MYRASELPTLLTLLPPAWTWQSIISLQNETGIVDDIGFYVASAFSRLHLLNHPNIQPPFVVEALPLLIIFRPGRTFASSPRVKRQVVLARE
jgi:hypothetical protein